MKKTGLLLKFLGTVLFFLLILKKIDPSAFLTLFQSLHFKYLPAIFVFNLSFIFLGAVNISILINTIAKIPLYKIVQYYAFGWSLSLISPAQMGDASLVLFLKKEGIPFHKTSGVYIMDKIITFSLYLLISAIGLTAFAGILGDVANYILLFILASIFLCLLGILLFKHWNQSSYKKKSQEFFHNTMGNIKTMAVNHQKAIFLNFLLTSIKIIMVLVIYDLAFKAFNANVSPLNLTLITIMASLIGYLPISLGGVGVVEFCAIFLWSQVGVSMEIVLATYAILRLNNVITGCLIFIFFMSKFGQEWLSSRKDVRSELE